MLVRRILAALAMGSALAGPAAAGGLDGGLRRHALIGAGVADDPAGARVTALLAGGAAAAAGLRAGDVVTSVGGASVTDASQFTDLVRRLPGGTPVPVGVRRAGARLVVRLTPAAAKDETDPQVATSYRAVRVDGTLRRTLVSVPLGAHGRRPGVLLVGGIGCYSIDAPTPVAAVYRQLAHDLARRGFVVLRLEKSGLGDSEGPPCMSVDLDGETRSYAAALDALAADPAVDPQRLYVLGHSIGSLIGPQLARSHRLAGLIVAEAVGRNWIEYELWNLRRQLELGGEPPDRIDRLLAEKELCMHELLVERRSEPEIEVAHPECRRHDAYPAPAAYLQEAAARNVAEAWMAVTVPVLAIYGDGDYVTAEADHRRIVAIVNARHPGQASLQVVRGMDHGLEAAGDAAATFALNARGGSAPYDPRFSQVVGDWLCARDTCLPSPWLPATPRRLLVRPRRPPQSMVHAPSPSG